MKVIHIINSLNSGGAEKLVTDLCVAYKERGVEVELALFSGKKTVFMERLLDIFPGIKIHVLAQPDALYSPKNIFAARRLIKKYHIVHVHLFPAFYWVGLASFFLNSKVSLFYTEHNTTNRRRNHFVLKRMDKIIYRRYTKIVTISDAVHHNLKEHLGKNKGLAFQINNGIDLNEISRATPYTKKELGFDEKTVLLLQVSSFTAQKDQKTLIKSLLHLPSHIHVLLVGEGSLKQEHETFTKDINLKDRVHFLGLRNDVPRLLKTVDAVVLSSNFEGLSLSCVEGLASGKPFIAADVPGLTEVVENYGVLFPKGDDENLAQRVNELLDDKDHYSKVTASCMDRAKDFNIIKMVDNYLKLYRENT